MNGFTFTVSIFNKNIKKFEAKSETLKQGDKKHNVSLVKKWLDVWRTYRDSSTVEVDCALDMLFGQFSRNDSFQNVLVKTSCLNDFYATNIRSIYAVAKVIHSMNIDSKLQAGDLNLVKEIADTIKTECKSNRREYSFASKYCSFHKPDCYPIFDSRNETILKFYEEAIRGAADLKSFNMRDYTEYVNIVNAYRTTFGLESFSYREIDHYTWTFCSVVMESKD